MMCLQMPSVIPIPVAAGQSPVAVVMPEQSRLFVFKERKPSVDVLSEFSAGEVYERQVLFVVAFSPACSGYLVAQRVGAELEDIGHLLLDEEVCFGKLMPA
jgi:hypothetical protein